MWFRPNTQPYWKILQTSSVLILTYVIVPSLTSKISFSEECSAGTYIGASDCIDCPIGSYTDSVSQSSCTQCTSGTSTVSIGSTSSSDCIGQLTYISEIFLNLYSDLVQYGNCSLSLLLSFKLYCFFDS